VDLLARRWLRVGSVAEALPKAECREGELQDGEAPAEPASAEKPGWAAASPSRPSPLFTDRPGGRQFGRFQIERELGRGGCGVVFLAFDPTLGRRVALKLPRPEALASPELRARFVREAKATAGLDHPNIVPVYEAGEHGPVWYIASAYCDGPTLAAWLKEQQEPVPPLAAAALLAVLAGAVQHAHSRGILHRDLKPANILLGGVRGQGSGVSEGTKDGACSLTPDAWPLTPKIADFGLAKICDVDQHRATLPGMPAGADAPTCTGVVLGTPRYMAPEQAEGGLAEVGPATDGYGLGVILYEVLAGRPPFQGGSDLATLQLVRSEEPVPLCRLRPDVPRDLEAICLKCLEKEPRKRYPSAAELEADLRRFLRSEPTKARPLGAGRRAWKWARRRPTAAALVAVSALTLLAMLGGAGWHFIELGKINFQLEDANRALEKSNSELENANTDLRNTAERERQHALYLRRLLYVNQFKLALQAWEKGQPVQAVEWLDALRPGPGQEDLRGFEWYYLKGLCHPWRAVWRGHQGAVPAVAVSSDGTTVASGSYDRSIRLWNVATGQVRAVLVGHAHPIQSLSFSPDGQTLASKSHADGEIRLWETATGKERTRFILGPKLQPILFTPDGKQFIGGSPDGIWIRDLGAVLSTERILQQPAKPVNMAITPDGRTLAVGNDDGTVRLWDLPSGRERFVLQGHRDVVCDVALSPDGRTLASGSFDRSARLWDVATGTPLGVLNHRYPVWALAFTPDGRLLATAPSEEKRPFVAGEVQLWDVASATERKTFDLKQNVVHSLAFLPHSRTLVLGCHDKTVRLLDVDEAPKAVTISGHAPKETWALAFSPDGRTLASGGDDHQVRLWDPSTGGLRATLAGHESLVTALAFSRDGRTLASASFDRKVKLWDGVSGRLRSTLTAEQDRLHCVAVSPDGRTLAAGGKDNAVRLWDLAAERMLSPLSGDTLLRALAFSPDGTILATAWKDGKVRLWDTSTWQLRRALDDTDEVGCLAFAADGKTLAGGNDVGVVRLWDVATGRERATLKGHVKQVYALAFAPDGRTLATAGDDKTVRLWQAATGEELLVLNGHKTRVNAVAFSPDGQTLASASHDGAVQLWRTFPRESKPPTP
jgi:WD40 repeat protein